MQKCYHKEPRFNGVVSRNNLPKIKNGAYVVNLNDYKSIETSWIALYEKASYDVTYFDSFGAEHVPKEI